jgi:hypothetical protein
MLTEFDPWVPLYLVAGLVLAGGIVWYTIAAERKVIDGWRRFALDRGLRFVAPETPWYRGKRFHVEGEVRGVAFRIEKEVVGSGKHSRTYTVLTARGPRLASGALTVRPTNFFLRATRGMQRNATQLGDAEFDRRFFMRVVGEPRPEEVLHEALREKLAAFGAFVELAIDGERLLLRLWKLERSPERLQKAIELAVVAYSPPRVPLGH